MSDDAVRLVSFAGTVFLMLVVVPVLSAALDWWTKPRPEDKQT